MGKKRFYDAVRDLIRDDVDELPEQPARSRRRLSIASLLAAPQTCAACWDPVPLKGPIFACHNCLGAYCSSCLAQYARTALGDRNLLPLRCADQQCRAPVPLSGLKGLLDEEEIARLSRFQCELMGREGDTRDHDEALQELMGTMGWRRCPDCGMGVERTQGCPHMVCVCGGEFCYSCGERWLGGGVGCPRQCGWPRDVGFWPARFDELREEVWQRIAALLESLRQHLEDEHVNQRLMVDIPRIEAPRLDKMRVRSLVHPSRE